MLTDRGQSLLELIVVMGVGMIVIGALVFTTIASLRNAQFSNNQIQATKLAQEALEKVRTGRDRNNQIGSFTISGVTITNWADVNLWNRKISDNCSPCYFILTGANKDNFQYLSGGGDIPSSVEDPLSDGRFKRVVILSDGPNFATEKQITAIVRWVDFAGFHESKLTTLLRKI